MLRPSATFHKSPKGVLKVIECSEDASVCLAAYKDCTEPGEVTYIRKGHFDKFKKNADIEVAKPKATRKKAVKKTISQ
jgi:hypothetical protein